MQEAFELDLREIFEVLLKRWWLIVLAAVVGCGLTLGTSAFIIAPQYTSSVSLYVNNSNESQAMSAVNINDINASQKLVNTYIIILQDDEVLTLVGNQLLAEYGADTLSNLLKIDTIQGEAVVNTESLRKVISMSAVTNTEVLKIAVESKSAALSARICTILTEVSPDVLMRIVKAGSVEVIGSATPADKSSSPNILLNSVIGLVAGMALCIVVLLLAHLLDNTIKDEDGLKKRFDIPILGEIPDFKSQPKGGYSHYAR